MAVTKTAIKGTAIETPGQDPASHLPVLKQLKEVAEIGQRLRGDPLDSFVRVSELVKLGIARLVNGTLQPYAQTGNVTGPVPATRSIFTPMSVIGGGNLSADRTLTLSGDLLAPGNNKFYATDGSGNKGWQTAPSAGAFARGATWVASTGAVTTPTNDVFVQIPRACTLVEVTIVTAGGPGSCTVDIWKSTFAGFPPVIGGTITGGVPPAIAAGTTYSNTVLAGWTTAFAQDDILLFRITASSTFTQVAITLRMT